jgi:L-ascorbate metabolism protein UlaG (beta-lactamase superfamily)
VNSKASCCTRITKTKCGKPIRLKGFRVGYLVETGGVKIYHIGDTDLIKEMTEIVDVLLVPIGGGSVTTQEEAADAVALLRPKIAVLIHYTDQQGVKRSSLTLKEFPSSKPLDIWCFYG